MPKAKKISLALQGGGAHGAYTWGVVDRLLEEDGLEIPAITATSAGAMNAVAFASGYAKGGKDGARDQLYALWSRIAREGEPYEAVRMLTSGPFAAFTAFQNLASPYDLNPFDYNPLRDVINAEINFDALQESGVDLFLSATNVETGRVKVFSGNEITCEAVMASACLPQVFKAVEIDGEAYWDGGYLGNPSLFPLIYAKAPQDVLLVLLNPISRDGAPKGAGEIADRINEISFNSALIGEMRAIAFVQKLLDEGMLKTAITKKYRRLNIHAIRGGQDLLEYDLSTKYDTSWRFVTKLRDMGRDAADNWLADNYAVIGTGASGLDLRAEFLEA